MADTAESHAEILVGRALLEGPTPCLLADLTRTHELQVGAALDILGPAPRARTLFGVAQEVVVNFDSPVIYAMSLIAMEDAVETTPGIWDKTLGQALLAKHARVAFQVIRGKLTFMFRGRGGAGLDLRSGALSNLGSAQISAGWTWRNEATLESRSEVVLAVESARYNRKRRRIEA